jgi:hypothetical protein
MTTLTLLYLSRINSDPGWLKKIAFIVVKNLKTCIAVLLYTYIAYIACYIMAKDLSQNENNGLDTTLAR